MSAKKSPKTPKDKLIGLLACGSNKKNRPLSNLENAPEEKPEEEEAVDYTTVNVRAYKGHEFRPSRGNEDADPEEGLGELVYCDLKLIGKGTFGVVYRARLFESGELVAIKKVFDDKRYKNRELIFMRRLQHPNVCDLKYYFYSEDPGCRQGERFLNMVLEFVPKTLFTIAKCDGTFTKPLLDPAYIKVYIFQLLRSLNYLHSMSICHRDIKPQNLLINPATHEVKLCDFGSAKELLKNESNVAYICSRYYRAPELILGAKDYTYKIDLWSAGCILAELYLGHPIFPGASGPDQMVEIMKILGTPTFEDITAIHHNCKNMVFPPTLMPMPWNKVFTKSIPSPESIHLISRLLVFNPESRIESLEALAHPFFQDLRSRNFKLPDGKSPHNLFNFTSEELENSPTMKEVLQPLEWEKNEEDAMQEHPSYAPYSPEPQNLKSKIVNLARSSFRKASFRRDKSETRSDDFRPPYHYQLDEREHELDMRDLADQEFEAPDQLSQDIQNLHLHEDRQGEEQEAEDGEKTKKKKKKKKSKSHQEEEGEVVVEEVGLDENVAFDGATGEVKKKRKKKKKIVGDEIGNGEYGGAVEDEEAEQTVLPYDGENLKKGRKKKKVKEYQVEEEVISSSPRRHKKHTQAAQEEEEEGGGEGYGVEVEEISVEKKKKKKKKKVHSLEEEV